MVVRTLTPLYSAEEFFALAALPENAERRLELEDGVILEMGSSSPLNSATAMRIGYFLSDFVMRHDLGIVTGADGGFELAPKHVRQPDVAFVSRQRAPALPPRFTFAPDLAVEVVSPDEDVFKKASEYLQAGSAMVWAVYAQDRVVYQMTLGQNGAIVSLPFGEGDVLEGGEVLPGLRLPVSDLFPE
jgi:Uma2 family endonuclease